MCRLDHHICDLAVLFVDPFQSLSHPPCYPFKPHSFESESGRPCFLFGLCFLFQWPPADCSYRYFCQTLICVWIDPPQSRYRFYLSTNFFKGALVWPRTLCIAIYGFRRLFRKLQTESNIDRYPWVYGCVWHVFLIWLCFLLWLHLCKFSGCWVCFRNLWVVCVCLLVFLSDWTSYNYRISYRKSYLNSNG